MALGSGTTENAGCGATFSAGAECADALALELLLELLLDVLLELLDVFELFLWTFLPDVESVRDVVWNSAEADADAEMESDGLASGVTPSGVTPSGAAPRDAAAKKADRITEIC